jgi:hypothetical protein
MGVLAYVSLFTLANSLAYSGIAGTSWWGYSMVLDNHIWPAIYAAWIVIVHCLVVLPTAGFVLLRGRASPRPWMTMAVFGWVALVPTAWLGVRPTMPEVPRIGELLLALCVLGLPAALTVYSAGRLAIGAYSRPA